MVTYLYRAKLTRDELIPAVGMGAGAGIGIAVVIAYFAQLFLRRRRRDSGTGELKIDVVPAARPSGRD
jgi:hypothetical protein